MFSPDPHSSLALEGKSYTFAEHPALASAAYGQEGRVATVYKLLATDGGQALALKVFKPRFRLPALAGLADELKVYAGCPGLAVCERFVLTASRAGELLAEHNELTYAMAMPWVDGPTWFDVVRERQDLTAKQSLALARSLATVLTGMEEKGLAHCDLSGPNLLLPALEPGGDWDPLRAVALVDVEDLHSARLTRPPNPPKGSPGYGFPRAEEPWCPEADRFAGALLLAEILGWCLPEVRAAAEEESYFAPSELQQRNSRYATLAEGIKRAFGDKLAGLLERVWSSSRLASCPTFAEWLVALSKSSSSGEAVPSPSPGDRRRNEKVQEMLELAEEFEAEGDVKGALKTYEKILTLAADDASLVAEIRLIMQALPSRVQAQARTAGTAPPAPVIAPVDPADLAADVGALGKTPARVEKPAANRAPLVALLLLFLILLVGGGAAYGYNSKRARSGIVEVTSDPAGATVTVDNVVRGTTPLRIADLNPEKSYGLNITLANHDEMQQTVRPLAWEATPVSVKLVRSQAQLTVQLKTPKSATVKIDDRPAQENLEGNLTFLLPVGKHLVAIEGGSLFHSQTFPVTLAAGANQTLEVELKTSVGEIAVTVNQKNARVLLANSNNEETVGVLVADPKKKGHFNARFKDRQPGLYVVKVSLEGFRIEKQGKNSQKLRLKEGGVAVADFKLEKIPPEQPSLPVVRGGGETGWERPPQRVVTPPPPPPPPVTPPLPVPIH